MQVCHILPRKLSSFQTAAYLLFPPQFCSLGWPSRVLMLDDTPLTLYLASEILTDKCFFFLITEMQSSK